MGRTQGQVESGTKLLGAPLIALLKAPSHPVLDPPTFRPPPSGTPSQRRSYSPAMCGRLTPKVASSVGRGACIRTRACDTPGPTCDVGVQGFDLADDRLPVVLRLYKILRFFAKSGPQGVIGKQMHDGAGERLRSVPGSIPNGILYPREQISPARCHDRRSTEA